MGIDIKTLLVEALLKLCQKQSLETITVKQLLEITGISRQSFYNHFLDKNDLIVYVYTSKIIPDFNIDHELQDFYHSLYVTFENIKKYHVFMKQACKMEGQNCLKDFIFEHCKQYDLQWHQQLYGNKKMPEELKFATIYHANASSSMTLSWILADMPVDIEEIVSLIVSMRSLGMEKFFEHGSPYTICVDK